MYHRRFSNMRETPPSSRDLRAFCQTAFWVAAARDIESRRPDALFHDPYIGILTGELGEEYRGARRRRGTGRGLVIRTAVIDALIARAIADNGVDTIVNLACGLDTRAFRCELPGDLRWFDVDLPELIAYRRDRLADVLPRCRYGAIAADLLDAGARRSALERATEGSRVALVLTEGFILYLTEAQAGRMAEDLARLPAVAYWLISVSCPRAPERRGRPPTSGPDRIRGSFRPASGLRFFETFGFREREFRSTFEEGIRLGRPMPFTRLSLLARRFQSAARREKARRAQGVALLEAIRPP
jgi:methyltransferase (TIGR00027 family)